MEAAPDGGGRAMTWERIVVNFVGRGRSPLGLLFASKADDKFERVSWRTTESGLPLLHEDVLAWAECTTMHDLEIGDHVILVARVEAGGVLPENEPPLMYYRRSWGVWSPVHEASEPEPGGTPNHVSSDQVDARARNAVFDTRGSAMRSGWKF